VLADFASSPGLRGHVVVVDNASRDGSADIIAAWLAAHPEAPVTLVRSAHNSGFSGGHNQGIAARRAEFYLVLNSDAVLTEGFCAALLAAARAQPEAGLFAPRIDYDDGSQQISCFRIPTPASELIRGAATGPVTRALRRYNMWLDMPPAPSDIGWASFAGILLRARMIEEIGPMDEGYFLYFEDTEYCLRACRAGWKIAYVPQARFVHFRGGSAPVKALARQRARLPRYYYASRTRLFYQAHGYPGLVAANLALYAGWLISGLRRLAGRREHQPVAQEWRDIWTNLLTPLGDSHGPGRTS
jgi:GT2 family glycosyltransferase